MTLGTMLSMLGSGFIVTLEIFLLTLIGALPLGVVVALARMSSNAIVSWIMRLYISLMRGTPLMLQMFAIYFAPYYVFGISLTPNSKFIAVIVAFILNYAAYFAEIYRSGIQSIPKGQHEAAEVLGYSKAQAFIFIILPQVFKRILPALTNEIVTLVKDTSLAFAIGVAEMFTTARALVASQAKMLPFIVAAGFYWIFCLVVEFIMGRIEKVMSYYKD
ncbi:MAG: amino acid ABC transporter permease [Eggerthellaceae bacterium]|nr:amino acid ABC transporter permease [Eggerthellaceae bacterium]